jgi:hypothetical protein
VELDSELYVDRETAVETTRRDLQAVWNEYSVPIYGHDDGLLYEESTESTAGDDDWQIGYEEEGNVMRRWTESHTDTRYDTGHCGKEYTFTILRRLSGRESPGAAAQLAVVAPENMGRLNGRLYASGKRIEAKESLTNVTTMSLVEASQDCERVWRKESTTEIGSKELFVSSEITCRAVDELFPRALGQWDREKREKRLTPQYQAWVWREITETIGPNGEIFSASVELLYASRQEAELGKSLPMQPARWELRVTSSEGGLGQWHYNLMERVKYLYQDTEELLKGHWKCSTVP